MKLTTFEDSEGKIWQTAELSPYSDADLLADNPKWEYYSPEELTLNAGLWAMFETSYDQFIVYHCVKVEDYNRFIEAYLND